MGPPGAGFVAHIPHYLAQLEYPRASAVLLEQVELRGGSPSTSPRCTSASTAREAEIDRYLSSNEEVADVVASLERQYDSFAQAEEAGSSLLADDQPIPTGDEIGQQFEQFLAGLEAPDKPEDEQ